MAIQAIVKTGTTIALVKSATTIAIVVSGGTVPAAAGVGIQGQHAIPTLGSSRFDKLEPRKRLCDITVNGQIVRRVPCEGLGRIMRTTGIHMMSNITRVLEVGMIGSISYKFKSTLEAKILRRKKGSISGNVPVAENIHNIIQNNLRESKLNKIKEMWREYNKWKN